MGLLAFPVRGDGKGRLSKVMSTRLQGIRVLLTRPTGEGVREWRLALEGEGATVLSYPTMEIAPPASWDEVDQAVARLEAIDWIVFTSQNAVRFFASRCPGGWLPTTPRIAAVGAKTAAVAALHGRTCEVVATDARQEGLLTALGGKLVNQSVLMPRAAVNRPLLAQTLRKRGCTVEEIVVYRNVVAQLAAVDPAFDVMVVGSPSALRGFLLKNDVSRLWGKVVVAIGPTSAAYARGFGLSPVIALRPDIHSIIEEILKARS
jgi:uroporphyrinogen-III synthase